MKLSGFSGIITTMFNDKMDINRYINKTNDDETITTILPKEPIHKDIPCRISFSSDENPKDNEVDDVPLKLSPKIFCKLDADIIAGDFVTVRRYDDNGQVIATYAGKIGLPSVFITHKEVVFSIERRA